MPFRFSKRFKIAPGVHISVGRRGVSGVSFGGKRARMNISRRGTSYGTSLGGGISYTTKPRRGCLGLLFRH